jgi:hypothetical protein
VNKTKCPHCGAETSADDAFCGECGGRLEAAAPAAASPPTPPTKPDPSPPTVAARVPDALATAATDGGPDSAIGDDVLVGAGMDNEAYQGHRLQYEPADRVETFDPLDFRFFKELFIRWLLFSAVGFIAFFVAVPVLIILAIASSGLAKVVLVLIMLAYFVFWLVFLFRPIPVSLSQAAGSAFEHITWALKRRQSPLRSIRVRRLSQPGQQSRDYLEIRQGIFTGYVSSFAYGRDLYIGWTYWWYLSPVRWALITLGRMWQTLTGRGSQVHIIARYEDGKALREAVHGAAREGVDVAAGRQVAQGAGTIGSDIPVDLITGGSDVPAFVARAEAGPTPG